MPDGFGLTALHAHRPRHRKLALAGGLFAAVLAGAAIGAAAWAHAYGDRIAPNVWIGSVPVGGLLPDSARLVVQKAADGLLNNGLPVTLNGGRPRTLMLGAVAGGDYVADADVDVDAAVAQAEAIGHESDALAAALDLFRSLERRHDVPVPAIVHADAVRASLEALYPDAAVPAEAARFVFREGTGGAWSAVSTDGKPGTDMDVPRLLSDVSDRLSSLKDDPIDIQLSVTQPLTDRRVADLAKPAALAALAAAPFTFTYADGAGTAQAFPVTAPLLSRALAPAQDGSLMLDPAPLRAALEAFSAPFDVEPQDARFQIQGGRVTQFAPSVSGRRVDVDRAIADLGNLIGRAADLAPSEKTLPLPVIVQRPTTPTAKANDLGIVTLLGTGVSSYAHSSRDRIRNIANGVKLLNGLLIPPGDTFSAIKALGPFTVENGYVPELVIKGDKIVPELGGGLCQIGTTTFRAAMHAGFPIVERHNHSLVVSHYNDPVNGNPGTDATIYDPEPDLKFTNDTGAYVLFEARMDPATEALTFSFWGTSDGRVGSYTAPLVDRWIPPGPEEDAPTADLPPGRRTCQNAFRGADASFTYTITRPDGSRETQTFASHYRALPKMCLVGEKPGARQAAALVPPDMPAADN